MTVRCTQGVGWRAKVIYHSNFCYSLNCLKNPKFWCSQIDQMLNLNCPEKSSCNPTLSTSSKRRVKKEPRNRTGRVAQAWPSAAVVRAGCLSLSCPNESPQISAPVLNTAANLLWCGQRRACTGKLLRSAAQQGPAAPNLLLSSISRKGGQVWGSRGVDKQQQARGMDLWPLMFFF